MSSWTGLYLFEHIYCCNSEVLQLKQIYYARTTMLWQGFCDTICQKSLPLRSLTFLYVIGCVVLCCVVLCCDCSPGMFHIIRIINTVFKDVAVNLYHCHKNDWHKMYNRLELVHVCADMTQMLWKTGLLMLTSVCYIGRVSRCYKNTNLMILHKNTNLMILHIRKMDLIMCLATLGNHCP